MIEKPILPKKHHRKFGVLILLIGIFAISFVTYNIASNNVPDEYEYLVEKAEKEGHISIIVGVDADFQIETNLNSSEVEQQRDGIQQARDRLMKDLSGYGVTVRSSSDDWVIPYIALGNVSEEALRHIIKLPYVVSIEENSTAQPMMISTAQPMLVPD